MKRFVVSICLLALALGDVFATKPSGEFLAGDATPMDTDIKRSGMNEMDKFLSMGMMKTEMKACKDKISSKKCKKLKKKGKCEDKKTWKQCKYTCKKCPGMCEPGVPAACSDRGTCTEEGFCNCDVGYFGDYCQFPEICDDEPGLLRDGDKIHLLNQYIDPDQDAPKTYLDTCGELKFKGCNGTYDVQTSASPNRDFGSGTWEIRSVKGTGGPIRYGDKIHLLNQFGRKSYLDTCVNIGTIENCKGKYGVQTTLSPDRDSGSGTWEISSEKCIGGPVRNGDKILLINQYKKKSYLDQCSKYTLKGCNGTYHVETSKIPNRDEGTSTWEIEIIFQGNEDFARFDKDADGLISLSEWIEKCALAMNYTMISSMVGREMNETTYNEIFNETDCDDDGNISPKELKMAIEQLGDGCCGELVCCPFCGIVIRTAVSALEGTIVSALGDDCPPLFKQVCTCIFGFCTCICVPCGLICL